MIGDSHASSLFRRKLERPGKPPLIHTLRGRGYMLGKALWWLLVGAA